jgi:serine/threonine protein kinase
LAHAHEQGLIHRDVKPGNLLVTPEGITKVSDLGLAAWLNETESDPRAGKIVGTADYLSPEQILTPRQVTPATDVYSLGCTLYYAVTGKVPFTGGGTRDKTRRHLEDMPLHPRRLNAELSDPFVDVIAAMMDKNVAQRIQTAAEVIRRLAPWSEDRVAAPVGEPMERDSLPFSYSMPPSDDSDGDQFVALPETNWQFEESLSQGSQATEPFAAISEETVPAQSDIWLPPRRKMSSQQWLLYSAAGLGVVVLLTVLMHLVFK